MEERRRKIPIDKNNPRIGELKKLMRRRALLALVFVLVNLISAINVAGVAPFGKTLSVFNLVAAVLCLPGLILPIVSLYMISRSDGIYVDAPETEPLDSSRILSDVASRFMFKVRDLYAADTRMVDLVKNNGIDIVEYHLDRIRAEAILTFAQLNDAKGARNILRYNDYNCSEIEELNILRR